MRQVEKWDVFEVAVRGEAEGNPFLDYSVTGCFQSDNEMVRVNGFYDGDGTYRVRFMPSFKGKYRYRIEGNCMSEPEEGEFEAVAPEEGNHGPVRVVNETALAYADGTPYYSIGTTCYAWVHQPLQLQEQTLATLAESPFNKIRFCIFPKFYEFNRSEPITYPFERGNSEGIDWKLAEKEEQERDLFPGMAAPVMDFSFDYTRPNVEHFQRFDLRIRQLREMGIEADLILMHPYDRWGMNDMNSEACDAYVRYVIARYGAFRNVWWSLANEYDLISTKTVMDWDRYGSIIAREDPYRHMCSIHNCTKYYDYSRNWVTHLSLQRVDFYRHVEYTDEYLSQYHKPVVWDEICYEGDIDLGWGNITGEELVRRFWESFLRGGHAGHGETFMDEHDILWWSHGGVLKGESAPRLVFLRRIMEETPGGHLRRGEGLFDEVVGVAENTKDAYRIHYLGLCRPSFRKLFLPEDELYEVELIDTWNMMVTSVGLHCGISRIEMPGKQYMAIRVQKRETDG